ncbi:MAG: Beta sliding clamp [Candidatus Adlerbacteria bacterium]|nr:Beta sliding clamp [Candidatus Adlerbacteria bacterium]
MQFETNTEELREAVSIAARFAERRANLPVLASIYVSAEGSNLVLRATNLECGIEVQVPARIGEEGVAAIPAHTLLGFLSNTRGKSVSVATTGEVLKIVTERASASIKTLSADDFPILPRVSASTMFSAKASDLARLIKSVAYCASTSAIKPELQSVLLVGESGKLSAAATDSFRLAEKTVPLRSAGNVPQLLLPAKNAAEFMRILETSNGEVEVYYNENQISAQIDSLYFTSRLIDAAFPNYRQILPKTFGTEVVVLREDFTQALKSLSIFADKFSHVSFTVDPENKAVMLSSRNPDVGEQTSQIRATITGDAATMSFNGRYLADSVQAISGESVRIQSNGVGKAILITDAADSSFFYLAMPMNR